jgi:hypothetical protein
MIPIALVLTVTLVQAALQPSFVPDCRAPRDAATTGLCAGEELLRHATAGDADDDERNTSWKKAADEFRRAADLARDLRYGFAGIGYGLAGISVTTVVRFDGKYLLNASLTSAGVSALMRSTRRAMIAGSWPHIFTAWNRPSQ